MKDDKRGTEKVYSKKNATIESGKPCLDKKFNPLKTQTENR